MQGKRLLAAAVLLPPFYFAVMKLPEAFFFGLLLTVSVIAQWEFYAMYRVGGLMRASGILLGAVLFVTLYFRPGILPHALMFSVMVMAAVRLFGKRDPAASLRDISHAMLAVLYIPVLLSSQLLLRHNGPQWIIFLFGCVWIADSFALYVGKGLGRRKLYAEVSPNKTAAGAVGSLAGGAFSGWLLNLLLVREMDAWEAALIGAIIGSAAVVGDLVESMFKRDAGVKDSSGIIPGHGGILDKIDGALFAGPVLYWIALAAGLMK
jgi:phosphatidate cytidylyltransferase